MNLWHNFYIARSLSDALEALAAAPGPARPIAGGTDLLLDMQQGRHSPIHTLVDITALPELNALEMRQNCLFVGAGVPLNRIVRSPLVAAHAPALVEACGLIGGPQVRNTATLGGNVGHALPAGDGTIALMALGAEAEVANLEGCRRVPLPELFLGPGRSALAPQELLVGFYLPPGSREYGSAFRRVMRPQGVAIAILNMGAWVHRRNDRIVDVRLAAGPSGPTPRRALAAEAVLRGRPLDACALADAAAAMLREAAYRSSPHRATAEYRRHLTPALLEETLLAAWRRAEAHEQTHPASIGLSE